MKTQFKYIKKCPGTPSYVCCGYHILDIAKSCPYGCSYCYLNFYLKDKKIVLNRNIEEISAEFDKFLSEISSDGHVSYIDSRFHGNDTAVSAWPGAKKLRIGTGEFTDSCFSQGILALTLNVLKKTKHKNYVLELKTKNALFDHRQFSDFKQNVIFSFSLNPPFVAERFEKGASPVQQRVQKLAEIQKDGFFTGFHFDPVISYKGWKKDYGSFIKTLRILDPTKILWISLGTLRFRQDMLPFIYKMDSIDKEFITGLDKKFRYFRDKRIEIYSFMKNNIESVFSKCDGLYLCMENPLVWEKVFSRKMDSNALTSLLDKQSEIIT